jgi:hypothetical protein
MNKSLLECQDNYLNLTHPRRIAFYRDRHRGVNESALVFLVLETLDSGLTWWCEPLAYASSPDDLLSKLLQEAPAPRVRQDSMIAGGRMRSYEIRFLHVHPSANIGELIARTFGAAQDKAFDLYEYDHAEVIGNDSRNLGSVASIVKGLGFSLPSFAN